MCDGLEINSARLGEEGTHVNLLYDLVPDQQRGATHSFEIKNGVCRRFSILPSLDLRRSVNESLNAPIKRAPLTLCSVTLQDSN